MRVFVLVMLCSLLLAFHEFQRMPDGRLHVHILDVGQGDSLLLISPSGKHIVIDGGPDMSLLEHLGEFMPFFDRHIELLILTHPDADHITALPEVLQRYTVGSVLLSGALQHNGSYDAFLHHIAAQGIPVLLPDATMDIAMGDGLTLDILWPSPDVFGVLPDDPNALSVVVRALYGPYAILLTGDIDEASEATILAAGHDVQSDIIKIAHHGSRTSSSTGFIAAVHPLSALISSGSGNTFGHPHIDVLTRLEALGITIRRTDTEGTVSLAF